MVRFCLRSSVDESQARNRTMPVCIVITNVVEHGHLRCLKIVGETADQKSYGDLVKCNPGIIGEYRFESLYKNESPFNKKNNNNNKKKKQKKNERSY